MKLTFLVLALACVCALNYPQLVQADENPSALPSHTFGGPEVPFPLSAQVDFPWATIEGVWQGKGNHSNVEFSFRIESDGANGRILHVVQMDPNSQSPLAQGTGVSSDDDGRTVRAIMVTQSGQSYSLMIGAFQDKSGRVYTQLTVRSFSGNGDNDLQFVVRKLSGQAYSD